MSDTSKTKYLRLSHQQLDKLRKFIKHGPESLTAASISQLQKKGFVTEDLQVTPLGHEFSKKPVNIRWTAAYERVYNDPHRTLEPNDLIRRRKLVQSGYLDSNFNKTKKTPTRKTMVHKGKESILAELNDLQTEEDLARFKKKYMEYIRHAHDFVRAFGTKKNQIKSDKRADITDDALDY